MCPVKYDMPDAQSSLEYLLEQVLGGEEVIISRYGVEVARVTAIKRPNTAMPVAAFNVIGDSLWECEHA